MKYIKIAQLLFGLRHKGGRNSTGKITAPRRGALTKQLYRFIDTKRRIWSKDGATILSPYIYDPNRSSYITLIMFPNGVMTYIQAGNYSTGQQKIYNLSLMDIYDPNSSQILKKIKNGSFISNCELHIYKGAQMLRSAGVSGLLLNKALNNSAIIKLKSGAIRKVSSQITTAIGVSSNANHFLINYKKAGRSRLNGQRPRSRPSAMNPVDHPMGGRTKGGIHPQSKTGILIGSPTANNKKWHNLEILSARKRRLKKKNG